MNYAEDTEFNAALRAHGIIPDLRPKKDESPSPPAEPEREPELDELSDLEDLLPSSVLEEYRSKRLAEAKMSEKRKKFGVISPISKPDYTREVTDASSQDLPGEPEGSGTGVVCYLFKDYLPDCKLLAPILNTLALWYPSTKFVSIVADHCIPGYPDKNVPTLLCYRAGKMTGQVVGLGGFQGNIHNLEKLLFALKAIDFELKDHEAVKRNTRDAQANDEDDSADETSSTNNRIRSQARGRGQQSKESDDDDWDI